MTEVAFLSKNDDHSGIAKYFDMKICNICIYFAAISGNPSYLWSMTYFQVQQNMLHVTKMILKSMCASFRIMLTHASSTI